MIQKFEVFLSYPHEKRPLMDSIRKSLQNRGIETWMDCHNIREGMQWDVTTSNALGRSQIFAILFDELSRRDRVQQTEIAQAVAIAQDDPNRHRAIFIPTNPDVVVEERGPGTETCSVDAIDDIESLTAQLSAVLEDLGPPENESVDNDFDICAGALLTCNIRGFSLLDSPDQRGITERLRKEIQKFVSTTSEIHWIDFREGEFSIIYKDGKHVRQSVECLVAFGYHLLSRSWGGPNLTAQPIGITVLVDWIHEVHWRPIRHEGVYKYLPDQDLQFLTGGPLQTARMILANSNRRQLLLTQEAWDRMEKPNSFALIDAIVKHADKADLNKPGPEEYEINVKNQKIIVNHRQVKQVYNLTFKQGSGRVVGETGLPMPRVLLDWRSRDDSDLRRNAFVMGLAECNSAVILGITHENTHKLLGEALDIRFRRQAGFWDELVIVFPSEDFIRQVSDQYSGSNALEGRRQRWEAGYNHVSGFLANTFGSTDENGNPKWRCLFYKNTLPFLGQHFIGPTNWFRIGPILPGGNAADSFFFEVIEGTEAYPELEKSFTFMLENCQQRHEWIALVEKHQSGDIQLCGICETDQLGTLDRNSEVLVTLIILHTEEKVCLQLRTKLNARRHIGVYSNFSGMVTAEDIVAALEFQNYDLELTVNDVKENTATQNVSGLFQLISDQLQTSIGSNQISGRLQTYIFQHAAVREIRQEIGIDVSLEQLIPQHTILLHLPQDSQAAPQLNFQIFSLRVSDDDLGDIKKARPNSGIECLDELSIRDLLAKNKLNLLFTSRFEDTFVPILKRLGLFKS